MAGSKNTLDELLSKLSDDLRQLLEAVERDPAFAKLPKDQQSTIIKLKTADSSYALVLLGTTIDIDVCLTKRERDVVRLVGIGEGNPGIARRLGLSKNTVK